MSLAPSADDVKLASSFDQLRSQLLAENNPDRLGKPLAFWVLPDDRRLYQEFYPRKDRRFSLPRRLTTRLGVKECRGQGPPEPGLSRKK